MTAIKELYGKKGAFLTSRLVSLTIVGAGLGSGAGMGGSGVGLGIALSDQTKSTRLMLPRGLETIWTYR